LEERDERLLEKGVNLDLAGEETRRTSWLPGERGLGHGRLEEVLEGLHRRWEIVAVVAGESYNGGCHLSGHDWRGRTGVRLLFSRPHHLMGRLVPKKSVWPHMCSLLSFSVHLAYNGGRKSIGKYRTQSNDSRTALYLALTIYHE
jgi:hypothetical protein